MPSIIFHFFVLLRTFLPKDPSETLDSSTNFGFPVRFASQTFFLSLVGLGVFRGVLLGSAKVFGSRFLGFVIGRM